MFYDNYIEADLRKEYFLQVIIKTLIDSLVYVRHNESFTDLSLRTRNHS